MIIHRVIQKLERGYFTRHTVCLNYEHIKMQLRKTNKTNQPCQRTSQSWT